MRTYKGDGEHAKQTNQGCGGSLFALCLVRVVLESRFRIKQRLTGLLCCVCPACSSFVSCPSQLLLSSATSTGPTTLSFRCFFSFFVSFSCVQTICRCLTWVTVHRLFFFFSWETCCWPVNKCCWFQINRHAGPRITLPFPVTDSSCQLNALMDCFDLQRRASTREVFTSQQAHGIR